MLKWVFIFEVILGRSGSVYSRHQFAFSVLKELAAHYNLTVMELLGYFYRPLASGLLTAYPAVRELIIALYLNAIDDSPAGISVYYPEDLKDRLSNPGLSVALSVSCARSKSIRWLGKSFRWKAISLSGMRRRWIRGKSKGVWKEGW